MTNKDNNQNKKTVSKSTLFGSGSALSGLLAFIGASCCVLPLVLINLGISGALVAQLAIFARYKNWLLGISLILVVLAFWFSYSNGKRPTKTVFVLLIFSSLLIVIAYTLPFYETSILQWIQQR
jgi:mercuric ion transport protein